MANNNTKTYISAAGVLLAIVVAGAGALKAWYALPIQVAQQAKDIEKLEDENNAAHNKFEVYDNGLDAEIRSIDGEVTTMHSDIIWMRRDLGVQKEMLREYRAERKQESETLLAEINKLRDEIRELK